MTTIKTPLVLFTFNRADNLRQQLDVLKEFKFQKIYFVSDGPRNNKDVIGVNECRKLIKELNNCSDLIIIENIENWGCKRNFLTHLNTIFAIEERVIVLEDDCIPLPSFFHFCDWALDFYEKDKSVSLVSGSNLLDYSMKEDYKCNFSRYINIWGWAGWRDKTWSIINPYLSISNLKSLDNVQLQFSDLNLFQKLYWKNIFKHSIYSHKIWDFYLQYGFFIHDSLSVYPAKNLIRNIGFGDDSTHTKNIPDYVIKSTPNSVNELILNREAPKSIKTNSIRDEMIFQKLWGYSKFNLIKLYIMNIIRYVIS